MTEGVEKRPRSYKKIKEMQRRTAAELEQAGGLTPRLKAYLAFREIFPTRTELCTLEELQVYNSDTIFNMGDSVFNFRTFSKRRRITPDLIRKWGQENPDNLLNLQHGTLAAEHQTWAFVEKLREDIHSREILQNVLNKIELGTKT